MADTLWLVADGKLQTFDGDLDDYQHWLRLRNKDRPGAALPGNIAGKTIAKEPQGKTRARDPLTRLRLQLHQVEGRIATLAAERQRLDAEFALDPQQPTLSKRRANLLRDVTLLESQWLEIGTAIEAAEARICDSN